MQNPIPELKEAFLGLSVHKEVLLPVYDLNKCVSMLAEAGFSEDEALSVLNNSDFTDKYGSVKPVFWLGNPEVTHVSVH
jgi:hypothetical protein